MPLLAPPSKPVKPVKPAAFAEQQIVDAILDASYRIGDPLPGERALSQALGVTRPTIRETLQRLAREGWITIAHGKPTRVNDYLSQGGLGLLATLARHGSALPPDMVTHLLEARTLMLPGVAALAARQDSSALLSFLSQSPGSNTGPAGFARYDWDLQEQMVILSGNAVMKMMFNDFKLVFHALGKVYFRDEQTRTASLAYYRELAAAIEARPDRVAAVVARAMAGAGQLWKART